MAEAATAQSLDLQRAVARLWISAQAMVRSLAKTGSPLFDPTVQNFQIAWNAATRLLGSPSTGPSNSCKPGVVISSLVEDGQYGPSTSTGLYVFAGLAMRSPPPCRAVNVPVWFAQNQDMIDAWVPADATVDNTEIIGPTPAANTQLTAATTAQSGTAIAQQDAGGASVQTVTQQPVAAPTEPAAILPASLCEFWDGRQRRRCRNVGFEKFVKEALASGKSVTLSLEHPRTTTRRKVDPTASLCDAFGDKSRRARCHAIGFEAFIRERMATGEAFEFTPKAAAAELVTPDDAAIVVLDKPPESELQFEDTPVIVARPSGLVPILAVGAGALVLGGVLWAFTRPRRRRAA